MKNKKQHYQKRVEEAQAQIWDAELSKEILLIFLEEMKKEWQKKDNLIKVEKEKEGKIDMEMIKEEIAKNADLEAKIKDGEKKLENVMAELEARKKTKEAMEEVIKKL